MDLATALLTGLGLAGAAGLNAYIPLFVVGLLIRFDQIDVAAPYDLLGQTPVLVVVGVLLVVELLADKIPAVDSFNDVIGTVVRPAAGAVLFAGSIGVIDDGPPWWGFVLGLITAGGVHATKASLRPVVNVSTAGIGAPVVSTIEDVISFTSTVLAIIAPVLVLVLIAVVVWLLVRLLRRVRHRPGAPTP